jgi:hypothetical protein
MACSLDRINSIKAVLSKLRGELHKITLDEFALPFKSSLGSMLPSPLNLIIIVINTNDLHARKARNLTRGSADTASDV